MLGSFDCFSFFSEKINWYKRYNKIDANITYHDVHIKTNIEIYIYFWHFDTNYSYWVLSNANLLMFSEDNYVIIHIKNWQASFLLQQISTRIVQPNEVDVESMICHFHLWGGKKQLVSWNLVYQFLRKIVGLHGLLMFARHYTINSLSMN